MLVLRTVITFYAIWSYGLRAVKSSCHHVPRGFAREVGTAEAGSSGQWCRG